MIILNKKSMAKVAMLFFIPNTYDYDSSRISFIIRPT